MLCAVLVFLSSELDYLAYSIKLFIILTLSQLKAMQYVYPFAREFSKFGRPLSKLNYFQ
jgi:hypothetical protein